MIEIFPTTHRIEGYNPHHRGAYTSELPAEFRNVMTKYHHNNTTVTNSQFPSINEIFGRGIPDLKLLKDFFALNNTTAPWVNREPKNSIIERIGRIQKDIEKANLSRFADLLLRWSAMACLGLGEITASGLLFLTSIFVKYHTYITASKSGFNMEVALHKAEEQAHDTTNASHAESNQEVAKTIDIATRTITNQMRNRLQPPETLTLEATLASIIMLAREPKLAPVVFLVIPLLYILDTKLTKTFRKLSEQQASIVGRERIDEQQLDKINRQRLELVGRINATTFTIEAIEFILALLAGIPAWIIVFFEKLKNIKYLTSARMNESTAIAFASNIDAQLGKITKPDNRESGKFIKIGQHITTGALGQTSYLYTTPLKGSHQKRIALAIPQQFDQETIWLLRGRNGVGKSTVIADWLEAERKKNENFGLCDKMCWFFGVS